MSTTELIYTGLKYIYIYIYIYSQMDYIVGQTYIMQNIEHLPVHYCHQSVTHNLRPQNHNTDQT